jgi:ketosteroid isomerase-like protein
MEATDVKIDVFGDVAVLTEYFHLSHTVDGEPELVDVRVTLVFLKTVDGWKIVHEHVTGKNCFDQ